MFKKIRETIFILVGIGVCLFIVGFFWHSKQEQNKTKNIVNALNIDNLLHDRNKFIENHLRYIKKLKKLERDIKTIGSKIKEKQQVAQTLEKVGDSYNNAKFLELAAKNYSLGLSIFPQSSSLNYKLGTVIADLGVFYKDKSLQYYTQAEELYQTSLRLKPVIYRVHYSLALLYLSAHEKNIPLGSLKQALSQIEKYLDVNDTSSEGYFLKARIYYFMGRKPEAIETYQVVLNMTRVNTYYYKQAKKNILSLSS